MVREYCTNRGTKAGGGVTRIGNDNWIMAYCHIAHDCRVGNGSVFAITLPWRNIVLLVIS